MLKISKNSEKLGYFDFISSGVFVERFDSLSLLIRSFRKKFLDDGTHVICSRLVPSTIQKNEKLIALTNRYNRSKLSYLESAEKIKRLAVENHAYTDRENNIQRVPESQFRGALDTGWIIMIRCIILI